MIVKLLETLATNAHHNLNIDEVLSGQSALIKSAFVLNNADLIKEQMPFTEHTANETHVVQL